MTKKNLNFYFGREKDRSYQPYKVGHVIVHGASIDSCLDFSTSLIARLTSEYGTDGFNIENIVIDYDDIIHYGTAEGPQAQGCEINTIRSLRVLAATLNYVAERSKFDEKPSFINIVLKAKDCSTTFVWDDLYIVLDKVMSNLISDRCYVILNTDTMEAGMNALPYDYCVTLYSGRETGQYLHNVGACFDEKWMPKNNNTFLLTEQCFPDDESRITGACTQSTMPLYMARDLRAVTMY